MLGSSTSLAPIFEGGLYIYWTTSLSGNQF